MLATIEYDNGDVIYVSGLTKLASISDIVNLVESVSLSDVYKRQGQGRDGRTGAIGLDHMVGRLHGGGHIGDDAVFQLSLIHI